LGDEWLKVGIPEIEIPWQQQLLAHDVPVSGYSTVEGLTICKAESKN
jgi:hypothetical protein